MMTRTGTAAVTALLLGAMLLAGAAKTRLDRIRPAEAYMELLYLPNGRALDVLALGFDAPLADLLYVRGLLYFSENLQADRESPERKGKYRYLGKLFRIITRLQPRFMRAYFVGGLFLLSTGQEKARAEGMELLREGLEVYTEAAAAGSPITPDESWAFHVQLAYTYETVYDRPLDALRHFRAAVASPNAPPEVIAAFEGMENQQLLGTDVLARLEAMIHVWDSLRRRSKSNPALGEYAENRLRELVSEYQELKATRLLEQAIGAAAEAYRRRTGRSPDSVAALVRAGLLPGEPNPPLPGDRFLLLPEGGARSLKLGEREGENRFLLLQNALGQYYRTYGGPPASLAMLVLSGILDEVPVHPLAPLGYGFDYRPVTGELLLTEPETLPAGHRLPLRPPEESETRTPAPIQTRED